MDYISIVYIHMFIAQRSGQGLLTAARSRDAGIEGSRECGSGTMQTS